MQGKSVTSEKTKSVDTLSFTIVSNGFADGPSQALRDYLNGHKADGVTMVMHPLVGGVNEAHKIIHYRKGKVVKNKDIRLYNRPPITYGFDPFIPLRISKDAAWFGFNNLACIRGIIRRKLGRSAKVIYWAVDFVPNRFGPGLATKVYDAVDRYICKHADYRVELTQEGIDARNAYMNIPAEELAPSVVVPMGAWLNRTPKSTMQSWQKKKIVYMGHIVERQGVDNVVGAMATLVKRDPSITLDIVGGGPDEPKMRELAKRLKLEKHITFHGFVDDHKDIEALLADATIAVAPYAKIPDNFSVTSDPGKVKAYLGASLPIVLTDVPPIAKILEKRGAAILCDDSPESVAASILQYLGDEKQWVRARSASEAMAKEFDWETILTAKLTEMNII